MTTEALYDAFKVSLAGGFLSLDRTAALQTMVSRPIVAAPVIGYILGNPSAGLIVGALLELIFIGDFPVGRYIPVHETDLSVMVSAMTITIIDAMGLNAGVESGRRLIAAGVVAALPLSLVAMLPLSRVFHLADTFTRRANLRFFDSAQGAVEKGVRISLAMENLKGLAFFFTTNALALFLVSAPAFFLSRLIFSRTGLHWRLLPAFAWCAVLGMAVALNSVYTDKRGALVFAASGIVAAIVFAFL
ncbi:MAG: PTS sugar transporter subunit IIC [Deltaproteobacteria bacterium]|nr:PTS sugar transporter subunit IIC [Deltaproteobacteria bacterium]